MNKYDIHNLLDRYLTGDLSPSEKEELSAMINKPEYGELLEAFVKDIMLSENYTDEYSHEIRSRLFEFLDRSMQEQPAMKRISPFSLRRAWPGYAASLLLCLCLAAYFLLRDGEKLEKNAAVTEKVREQDLFPGGNRAVLTLADATTIVLDSAGIGSLAYQGNTIITKSEDGAVAYTVNGPAGKNAMMNSISTPVGGQYQLTLSDGSRVWLNATSSVSFPVDFTGKERKVRIKGEAYFEVKSNKEQPFIVDIDGKSLVEVLGTSFNINAYSNEEAIATTLLSGVVRMKDSRSQSYLLKPGQQALVDAAGGSVKIVSVTDKDRVIAWKNGMFGFNDADLPTIMRQLERWYDIKVIYRNKIPSTTFSGEIFRNVNLSTVLEGLKEMGIECKLENTTLIVF